MEVLEDKDYMILVESFLDSSFIKKTEQIRAFYLFFSVLDKYINEYGEYLGLYGNWQSFY